MADSFPPDLAGKLAFPGSLTLGSGSPRRADLLRRAGLTFDVVVNDIDEERLLNTGSDPQATAAAIAEAKFNAFPTQPRSGQEVTQSGPVILLTADTLVSANGPSLGKPTSIEQLKSMLREMSGTTITVTTAVCAGQPGSSPTTMVVDTRVALRALTNGEIASYSETGGGMDKAGGLALQSTAKPFIRQVDGCWSNVLGLPLCAVESLLDPTNEVPRQCRRELCGSETLE